MVGPLTAALALLLAIPQVGAQGRVQPTSEAARVHSQSVRTAPEHRNRSRHRLHLSDLRDPFAPSSRTNRVRPPRFRYISDLKDPFIHLGRVGPVRGWPRIPGDLRDPFRHRRAKPAARCQRTKTVSGVPIQRPAAMEKQAPRPACKPTGRAHTRTIPTDLRDPF